MADDDSVFGRMKKARLHAGFRLGESVSQERMAELVSRELGRVLHPTQWRRYETDREPPLDVIVATARVSGVTEHYIAFGGDLENVKPARTAAAVERPDVPAARAGTQKAAKKKPA